MTEDDPEGGVGNKLWMGDLEPYMEESFLKSAFAHFGYNVQNIKWIRNHQTGMIARYAFIEFNDPIVTRQILERLNNQFIPGTNGLKKFKLNWASRKIDSGQQEYNIFVADLSRDVNSQMLLEFFQKHFKSVRYAKVIEDDDGISKGYGFVRFTDEHERNMSYTELDGSAGLGKKTITIKPALAPKTRTPQMETPAMPTAAPQAYTAPAYYSWPYSQPYYPAYGYTGYTGYTQPTEIPTPQQLSAPPTEIYYEDLEDPNPPLDVEAENTAVFQQDRELFDELEGSRWNSIESANMKL